MFDSTKITIVGAGAVGCWVGAMLASKGARVTLIGRTSAVAAIHRDGLTLLRGERRDVARCEATTDMAAAADGDLVLLCVKSADTVAAAEALAPHLGPHAALISLQNGVDNADRAAAAMGRAVFASAVYVGCEIEQPGVVRLLGRGDLALGRTPIGTGIAGDFAAEAIAARFAESAVPCVVTDDIAATLWQKLIINCAYNAICALTGHPYGVMIADPVIRTQMEQLAAESIAVGQAHGVQLDATVLLPALWKIGEAMPKQMSSTAQDLLRGRRTEIDALNGHVAALGARLGVATPESSAITARIHERVRARIA